MKYIILLSLMLVGCSYNPDNLHFGDKVEITDGFFKGCKGYVRGSLGGITPCDREFRVEDLQCNNGSKSLTYISVCDLEKIKE